MHVLYLVHIGHTAVLKDFNDHQAVYQSIYMYVILANTVQWQKSLGVHRFDKYCTMAEKSWRPSLPFSH